MIKTNNKLNSLLLISLVMFAVAFFAACSGGEGGGGASADGTGNTDGTSDANGTSNADGAGDASSFRLELDTTSAPYFEFANNTLVNKAGEGSLRTAVIKIVPKEPQNIPLYNVLTTDAFEPSKLTGIATLADVNAIKTAVDDLFTTRPTTITKLFLFEKSDTPSIANAHDVAAYCSAPLVEGANISTTTPLTTVACQYTSPTYSTPSVTPQELETIRAAATSPTFKFYVIKFATSDAKNAALTTLATAIDAANTAAQTAGDTAHKNAINDLITTHVQNNATEVTLTLTANITYPN